MKLPAAQFLHLAAGAAALPAVSRIARAQAYPTRPVRWIVAFRAGRRRPTSWRALMGQWLSERLGQPFVIENRPGAGGNIGTEAVVRAPADGYTLLLVGSAQRDQRDALRQAQFQFHPRHRAGRGHHPRAQVMVVNPSVPAKTVPEFIAYAKANPGKINMASAGIGTAAHVAGELFKMMAGVNMVHVPYRGGAPALTDLIGGQVQVMFVTRVRVDRIHQGRQAARAGGDDRDALGGAAGHSDRGRFRAGLRGERLVRRRRAQEHARRDLDKLNKEINAGLADPKMKARIADLGGTRLPVRPPTSASSSPTKPRSGPR